ncbi:uncharacterized protein LOC132034892 [Lycium ferocissimum]|uniref:uncharacterized protein LOC132034892 n=1 Tax=Lycium ferocissimum TaxID=112874 RepID=UPI002814FCF3|nr:uncharacterized protein LOC132034892 [Lycium ferocissimum]
MLQKVADKVSARDVWFELEKICCPMSIHRSQEGSTMQPIIEEEETRAKITLLHKALHDSVGLKDDVEKSLQFMVEIAGDALAIKECVGETPLHYAARFCNLYASKILVNTNSNLPHVASVNGLYPIHVAAEYGYEFVDLVRYFFKVTTDPAPYTGRAGVRLLYRLIRSDLYDLATELIEKFPDLAKYSSNELSPLRLLATKVNALCDTVQALGSKYSINVYFCIASEPVYIRDKEWKQQKAVELAECLCKKLKSLREEEINSIVGDPLLQAASCDNYKLVEIIVKNFPSSVYCCNENGKNIFHISVENHCKDAFKLVYEISDHRHRLLASIDFSNNTMLHLAGKLSPENKLNRTFGVPIQMQQELQWFEEVKKCVPPCYYERLNKEGKKVDQLFTEEHANLKKEGEKWLKDTASACTIVSALVAAIAFAAAITVPGGHHSDSGLPIFLETRALTCFYVSNAFSLFTSCSSLIWFFSIWVSRYAEEDFHSKLPARLMWGFASMLASILSMIISFSSTLYIVSGQKIWAPSLVGVFLVSHVGFYICNLISYHFGSHTCKALRWCLNFSTQRKKEPHSSARL